MGTRSERLATEFEQAVADFVAAVQGCSDAGWSAVCNAEGWTVAQLAQHLSGGFSLEMEFVTAAADGRPLPAYSWDEINRLNDDRAVKNATTTQADVLREVRDGADATRAYIQALSDQQLDASGSLVLADGAAVTTQYLIKFVLIDHFHGHLESIRAAGR